MEEKMALVQQLRPIDDVFFEVLIREKCVCEEILRTILEDSKLTVLQVRPQDSIRNLRGRSVRLDALCQLGNGKVCNIEVQKADDDDHLRRARYNASCITANVTEPGIQFKDVPDVVIVYLSQNDFFKDGKTIYHVDSIIRETGKRIDNGLYMIFVNTQINDGSDIAALMQCFLEKEPNNSAFPEIRDEVQRIKHTKGGVSAMSEIMENYAKEYAKEFVKESTIRSYIEACKEFTEAKDATIKRVSNKFGLSPSEAAEKVALYWN